MPEQVYIRDPRGETRLPGSVKLPKLPSVNGRTAAILNNGWTSMDLIATRLAAGLVTRYGVCDVVDIAIPIGIAAEQALLDSVVARADFAVVGLAN